MHLWDDDTTLRNDPDLPNVRLPPGKGMGLLHPRTKELVTVLAADLRDRPDEAIQVRAEARRSLLARLFDDG